MKTFFWSSPKFGQKNGLVLGWKVFILVFIILKFSEFLGLPPFENPAYATGITPWRPSKLTPKNQVFERLNLGCQLFFDICRYVRDNYFDIIWGFGICRYVRDNYFGIIWGYHLPKIPLNGPQKSFF